MIRAKKKWGKGPPPQKKLFQKIIFSQFQFRLKTAGECVRYGMGKREPPSYSQYKKQLKQNTSASNKLPKLPNLINNLCTLQSLD